MTLDIRYSNHPDDSKHYDTAELRKNYLIEKVFVADEIALTYSHQDRMIAGGAMPVKEELKLGSTKELGTEYFLERREMGIINVGGKGVITLDGTEYELDYKDGMYIGMGTKEISFRSADAEKPAKFYINSSPAHKTYPTVFITKEKANHRPLGSEENMNKRVVNQYIHPNVCESCALQMGMTELDKTSSWNTMPSHTHERRMEVYFYFELEDDNIVFHFMGQPQETRHIIMHNEQAVISPSWSIHSGTATSNYTFIWGMCGENQTYDDMDTIGNLDLR
ncbi:5-dehydro-4-deoxy-D-glucuronate isomerase [uncultured Ruminococcus sp.]|uniref:5-dehydro-4-deoxy-D-glucuronate isomerase n=1 Tax=uncultured Ruminococcus sp. TaxID=165186 RepID=UPI000EF11527|nr:5-dehydro-4-deoxy-D-glucuronate isomerase [uncultured Ruminococcus sp.]HCJ41715.1 5-dehydro-4-deoxy-D-glucuronate isomerase [Ruminococcus sp.]